MINALLLRGVFRFDGTCKIDDQFDCDGCLSDQNNLNCLGMLRLSVRKKYTEIKCEGIKMKKLFVIMMLTFATTSYVVTTPAVADTGRN